MNLFQDLIILSRDLPKPVTRDNDQKTWCNICFTIYKPEVYITFKFSKIMMKNAYIYIMSNKTRTTFISE